MQRRSFLSLLALAAVTQFLQACGNSSRSTGTGTGRSTLRGNAARIAVTPDDAVQASVAVNAFAHDLYDRLVAADPTANLVFSPASIAIALTMAAAGARGATVREMEAALHI
ncbi:MAG: serpin family protein, partial [Actinomycetota bacterium]